MLKAQLVKCRIKKVAPLSHPKKTDIPKLFCTFLTGVLTQRQPLTKQTNTSQLLVFPDAVKALFTSVMFANVAAKQSFILIYQWQIFHL